MSDSNEPSYYEIALTNRQVLVAFVILLLAVLLAFLGGVWLGRKGSPAAVRGHNQEQIATAQQQEEQPPLKQFNFFSDEEKAGKAKASPSDSVPSEAPRAVPQSTLERQVAGIGPSGSSAEAKSKAAEDVSRKAVVQPPSTNNARSEPQAATATSTKERVKSVPSTLPDTTTGDLVIQVFSSISLQQAEAVTSRLKKAGYRAFLSPVKVGGQVMHRVRIGPFEQPSEAERVAGQIRKSFKLDTWITH